MKYDCIYHSRNCKEECCPCSLYTEDLVLTEEEEKLTKHCEDFCPIYQAIHDYNMASYKYDNMHTAISCTSEMCNKIIKVYVLRRREDEKINNREDC